MVVLFALFVVCALTAARGTMGAREAAVFEAIYGMSDQWRGFALAVTQMGNAWLLLGLVGLLFVVRWNPKPADEVLRNGVAAYGLVFLLKSLINRARPVGLLEDVVTREVIVRGSGFPSGHTALATVMSLTLLPYLPRRWRWVPVAWIGLVGWSRIYLGVHAPLDVVGGFALGVMVVGGAAFFRNKPDRP